MMRTLILFSVLLQISMLGNAQDTIFKRNNEQIVAKIIEITPTQIKYKKFTFQDGPNYVEEKSEIQMIIYSNGLKEEFEEKKAAPIVEKNSDYYADPPLAMTSKKIGQLGSHYTYNGLLLSENELYYVLLKKKDVKIAGCVEQAKKSRGMQYIGFGAIPFGIAAYYCLLYGSGLGSYNTNSGYTQSTYYSFAAVCGIIAVACPIESIISKGNRNRANKDAVKMFNEKY